MKREREEHEEISTTIWGTDWYYMRIIQDAVIMNQEWNKF